MSEKFTAADGLMVACLGAGGVMVFLDQRYGGRGFGSAAFLLFGAGCAVAGLEWIQTRRVSFTHSYTGFAAACWGFLAVLAGAALITAGLVRIADATEWAEDFLKERPGIAILAVGAGLTSAGLGLSNPDREEGTSWRQFWATFGQRLSGGALVLLGLVAGLAGLFELILPGAFDAAVQAVVDAFPKPPSFPQ